MKTTLEVLKELEAMGGTLQKTLDEIRLLIAAEEPPKPHPVGAPLTVAPDLLEALEELVAECGVDPKPLPGMSYFNAQIGPEAYQAAKDAIAKARGKK